MFNKKFAIFIVVAIIIFPAITLNSQQPDQATQELTQEYMKLNQELQTIQQQVFQDPAISKKTEELSDLKDKKMLEIDPNAKELLSKRDSIADDFEKAQNNGNQPKMQELQQNYQKINKKLQPLNQQVMQIDEVQKKQQEIQSEVILKMQEIDPTTNEKIKRIQEIQREMQQN